MDKWNYYYTNRCGNSWNNYLPRTTVLVPISSLPTEEYFRGRPARPHPAGLPCLGLPDGLDASRTPFRVPPPPHSISMHVLVRSHSIGSSSVVCSPWGTQATGAAHGTRLPRLQTAGPYEKPFTGTYEIVQTWTNGTITILTGAVTSGIIIPPLIGFESVNSNYY